MAKMRKKSDLPAKDCLACGRPFTWRKKWARDWDSVRYCSDACRSRGSRSSSGHSPAPSTRRSARS
ncbi:MAG: DUF2256 domain-containing protein [Gemmatimonadaceae bacterium]|nr:DUF2256 domain-containing protein [Gemmatimonadaceae bacterium]